jgi:hypothetical protein
MRSMDVLLLLHGLEPICSEYIPSKLYEYLWMQRPILAMVHLNEQMANLLREQGHIAIETSARHNPVDELAQQIEIFFEQWRSQGLIDNRSPSPYTTLISAYRLIKIALQVIQKSTLWHH